MPDPKQEPMIQQYFTGDPKMVIGIYQADDGKWFAEVHDTSGCWWTGNHASRGGAIIEAINRQRRDT